MSRGWPIRVDYPSKTWLSESEAMGELRHGPEIKWFEPLVTRVVLVTDVPGGKPPYGLVHMRGRAGSRPEVKTFYDRSELAWALGIRVKRHAACVNCQGLFYFAPDEPVRLRMVAEDLLPPSAHELRKIARRRRQQQRRSVRFHKLLLLAAELAASKAGAGS
ncbi:hypothetical protein [Clavibacter zhangzhiyongii]|uniref:hypothetical protein n=1 Tax=Clavibacter zhangzhiyongii TaxID=2768071 RepID=UPI00195AD758|nr:hypothetical protein [Clavibacter zhangzhiyongii]MBM7025039.1 hypothetical protein [Clavibacter zhangzhiyongii]